MKMKHILDNSQFKDYHVDWLTRKEKIDQLAEICLKSPEHFKIGKRLIQCGIYHAGYKTDNKLLFCNISHCRVRACPDCQMHRQRRLTNKFGSWIGQCITQHPELNFAYLSIGFRNAPLNEVRIANKSLRDGFVRLTRRNNTKFTAAGWTNFFEFTICTDANIHLNTHSLIALDTKSNDVAKYLQKQYLIELIQQRFKLDYPPNIDISTFNQENKVNLVSNLKTAFFYSAKPQTYIADPCLKLEDADAVTWSLLDQFKGSHAICPGALFKEYPKQIPVSKTEPVAPTVSLFWNQHRKELSPLNSR